MNHQQSQSPIRTALFTLLSAALLGLGSCGSAENFTRTTDLATEFTSIGDNLGTLKQQVDESVKGLGMLTKDNSANAESAYGAIAAAASAITPAIDGIKGRLEPAEAAGKSHFENWSRQNTAIQDAQLQARATERQNELAQLMRSTTSSITKAVGFGTSYQQSLQDLQMYLSHDLSPTAIGNAADLIARIRGEGGRFSAEIDSARKDASYFASKLDN